MRSISLTSLVSTLSLLSACSIADLEDTPGGESGGAPAAGGTCTNCPTGGTGGGSGGTAPTCNVAPAAGQTPYAGSAIPFPGGFEAEDYDQGGEGIGYHDLSPGNEGNGYRQDDVDIKSVVSGYAIGWIQSGEWLAYTIDVETAGKYRLEFQVGSLDAGRTFDVEACGESLGSVQVPQVSAWGEFGTATLDVVLAAGVQVLRIQMGALDYMDLDSVNATLEEPTNTGGTGGTPNTGGTGGIVGDPTFGQVVNGIRPRGQQCGGYQLEKPKGGKEIFVATNGSDGNSGSSSAPFKTIQKAADVAGAGDVVTIKPGSYSESVNVKGTGTSGARLVFQAEKCGEVILTGGGHTFRGATENSSTWRACKNEYVSLRGLTFKNYNDIVGDPGECHGSTTAVSLCTGWRVEDCLFDHAADRAIRADSPYSVVTRTTIQNSGGYSIVGAGKGEEFPKDAIEGMVFSDLVIKNNNDTGLLGPACGASVKILFSKNVVVDNIESFGNTGPGWWFDWENWGFSIKNSYFHDNKGRKANWEGPGVWIEGPSGQGEIAFNVFRGNTGPGLGLLESHDHDIHHNLFAEDGIELRGINDGGRKPASGHHIHHNSFRLCGTGTSLFGWTGMPKQDNGYVVDQNTYQVGGALFSWGDKKANSLSDMQSMFGFEAEGKIADVPWPPAE